MTFDLTALLRRHWTLPWALALAAGLLMPLALAPFDFWPASLLSVALLFVALAGSGRRAFWLGYAYGLGKYGLGVSWVFVSIHQYGNASIPLAALLVALFVAGLALFPALFTWLWGRFVYRSDVPLGWCNATSFALAFVLHEWVTTWLLTGFPWLLLGYAHLDTVLASLAPVGGVLLISLAVALSGCWLVAALFEGGASVRLRWSLAGLAAAPWVLALLASLPTWVQEVDRGSVALVQGNVPQEAKWRPETVAPIMALYQELSEPHWGHDLVIWPEAALTAFQHQIPDYLADMDRRAAAGGTTLVMGIPAYEQRPDGTGAFLNTAIALGQGDGAYTKRRLVPFGEYVPLAGLLRGLIDFFDLPMSRAVAGPENQPPLIAGGRRLAMAICYEIVYPDLVQRSARDADLLVTISNDAWFGHSIGPHQHMQKARMRALENGRYLLRATNNGITGVVDHRGRLLEALPQFELGVLEREYRVMGGRTWFSRTGSTPLLVLMGLGLGLLIWLPRHR